LEKRKDKEQIVLDEDGLYATRADAPEERAILVGVNFTSTRPGASKDFADLEELERLADTAGAVVVGRMEQRRQSPDVRTLIGKGKAEQINDMAEALDANLIIFDNDLSAPQGRNLEKLIGARIIDRTELILDIFVRHARTRQARLQVGLAQLEYYLPRLARMWTHLERQAGGIGTRGPGETQIETDRRIIRRRITQLKRDLSRIERTMETQNKQRRRHFRVALVGYTNAGKSSLMNQVTEAKVYVQDQLFATLDATTRRVDTTDSHDFLLTDTVGFIRKLPHHLVESFRATLSEVRDADLLLHVVDAGDLDYEGHMEAVEEVLKSLAEDPPERVLVFNKIDTLDPDRLSALRLDHPDALFTSALSGAGLDELLEHIDDRLRREERRLVVQVPAAEGRSLAILHELSDVVELEWDGPCATITLRVDSENYGRVLQLPGVEVLEVRSRG
jgi:GTP-binding protein HflX